MCVCAEDKVEVVVRGGGEGEGMKRLSQLPGYSSCRYLATRLDSRYIE